MVDFAVTLPNTLEAAQVANASTDNRIQFRFDQVRCGCSDLIVVGQFPPPVNGFSYITERMVNLLRSQFTIETFDIASEPNLSGPRKHLSRTRKVLAFCRSIVLKKRPRATVCYVACEGKLGLVYTIAALISARISGYRIYLHHHNYTYIDRHYVLMRLVVWLVGQGTHVFLCEIMRRDFEARYRRPVPATVVSNAAFVPPQSEVPSRSSEGPLVLGHLSNLTREKGLHIFLALLREAVASGRDVRGILAGPVAGDDDRLAIEAAQHELGERLDYRGPLYNADKDLFYRDIDVFVFPTQYANEAQPTVLFEALAAGCKILSFNRGCIVNQVRDDGLVVLRCGDFVAESLKWVDGNAAAARNQRGATAARYRDLHQAALETAKCLFDNHGTGAAS